MIALDSGRVVEQGPHGQLVVAGGPYARLWAAWSQDRGPSGDPPGQELETVNSAADASAALINPRRHWGRTSRLGRDLPAVKAGHVGGWNAETLPSPRGLAEAIEALIAVV